MQKLFKTKQDESKLGKGARRDDLDPRDKIYRPIGAAAALTEAEWKAGYDVEKVIKRKIPLKNQFGSLSCVGQAFSYYVAVLNTIETGKYDEASAKAIYSQIFLPGGGAQFRDGAKLVVNWGAVLEEKIKSYKADGTTDEPFMEEKKWITPEIVSMAKALQAKEYRSITGLTIDTFARAIKDGHGMVAGVEGNNNGTWYSNEPKPPTGDPEWAHALFFGKYGMDTKGKYIATPNSWGVRGADISHPDGWQRLREDWFTNQGRYIFSPWVLIDKPNLLLTNEPMVTIQKEGEPGIYILTGELLIPIATDWSTYLKDFIKATIIILSPAEFAKLKIATAVRITKI